MKKVRFEWEEEKDKENQAKHNVSFSFFLFSYTIIIAKTIKIDVLIFALIPLFVFILSMILYYHLMNRAGKAMINGWDL